MGAHNNKGGIPIPKFKKGDKVKIPKKKSVGNFSHEYFTRQIAGYKLDYLLVDRVDGTNIYLELESNSDIYLFSANYFRDSDLEPYEERYNIEDIRGKKIAVNVHNKEQWDIVQKYFTIYYGYGTGGESYKDELCINMEDGCYCSKGFYIVEGYKIIDFSQINFNKKMEATRKITGYKAPYNIYEHLTDDEKIKKGDILTAMNQEKYYGRKGMASQYLLAKEIVETWEPAYEEEFKVGDWVTYIGGGKSINTSSWIPNKITGKITKIEEDQLYVSPGCNSRDGFRLATATEIEGINLVRIGNYNGVKNSRNEVAFGCQAFTREELNTIRRLVTSSDIKGKLTIQNVLISTEMIDKLLKLIDNG
jgi:hypothetical protein